MCAPDSAAHAIVQSAGLIALAALPSVVRAADPEVLDEDFLDYLAEFENEDDNWSWFDAEAKPSAAERSSSAQRNEKPKEKVEP
jgi:hypothetical protein